MSSALRLAMEFSLIDGASTGLRRLTDQLQQMGAVGEQAAADITQGLAEIGQGVKLVRLGQAIKESVLDGGLQAAGDMQEALKGLEVELDRGSVQKVKRQLKQAGAEAARVAAPTAFSAEEVVAIQTSLKRAGLDLGDVLGQGGAAEAVAQLATADRGLGAEGAQQAVITGGGVFGLKGAEYAGFADLLARAGSAGTADAGSIAEALKMAPKAGSMRPEEVLGALATVSPVMQGSMAGTSMNAFLTKASQNNARMGLGLFNEDGSRKSLVDQAAALQGKFGGLSEQKRDVALTQAFGEEGSRFALALMQGDLAGTMEKMGRQRSLGERVDILSGSLNAQKRAREGSTRTLVATLFEPLLQPFGELERVANDAISSLTSFAENTKGVAEVVSFTVAGLAGGATVRGGLRAASGGAKLLRGLRSANLGNLFTDGGKGHGGGSGGGLGVQSVFVTNWPGNLGGLGDAGGKGPGKLGQALNLLSAGAAGYAAGSFIDQAIIGQDTRLETLTKGAIGLTGNITPWRLFMDQEERTVNSQAGANAANMLAEMLNLNVRVNVAKDGSVSVTSDVEGQVQQAQASAGML